MAQTPPGVPLVTRLVTVLAALAFVGGVAACSLNPTSSLALTADEWAWCQGHWRDGLEPSQPYKLDHSTWYFNHMGMRDDPDTIRVCRLAVAKR